MSKISTSIKWEKDEIEIKNFIIKFVNKIQKTVKMVEEVLLKEEQKIVDYKSSILMSNISGVISSIRQIMWQDNGLNGDAQRVEQLGWMLFLKIFCDKDKELEILNDNYVSPIPTEYQWDNWAANDEGMTGDELAEFVDPETVSCSA